MKKIVVVMGLIVALSSTAAAQFMSSAEREIYHNAAASFSNKSTKEEAVAKKMEQGVAARVKNEVAVKGPLGAIYTDLTTKRYISEKRSLEIVNKLQDALNEQEPNMKSVEVLGNIYRTYITTSNSNDLYGTVNNNTYYIAVKRADGVTAFYKAGTVYHDKFGKTAAGLRLLHEVSGAKADAKSFAALQKQADDIYAGLGYYLRPIFEKYPLSSIRAFSNGQVETTQKEVRIQHTNTNNARVQVVVATVKMNIELTDGKVIPAVLEVEGGRALDSFETRHTYDITVKNLM